MARAMIKGPIEFTAPRWAAEPLGSTTIIPVPGKLDPAQFAPEVQVTVVVGVAGAAAGAGSVPVGALSGPIPNGSRLSFGVLGLAGLVTLTSEALAGDVALTVDPLIKPLVSGDTATYLFVSPILTQVPSGTVVGRTYAERDAGTPFGPAAATDDEIFILAFDVEDVESAFFGNADCEFYKPGFTVKENYLPQFATLAAGVKTALRAKYICITGKE